MLDLFVPLSVALICIGMVIALVVAVAVLVYINNARSQEKAAIAANWLKTTGRIAVSIVEEAPRTRADDDTFFHASITYTYTVDDQGYSGKQAVGKATNLAANANRVVEKYPVGTEVTVHYNPDNPAESSLAK